MMFLISNALITSKQITWTLQCIGY